MSNLYLLKNSYIAGGNKVVHNFQKYTSSKVTIIARLEFELKVAVSHVSHYSSETPHVDLRKSENINICILLIFLVFRHSVTLCMLLSVSLFHFLSLTLFPSLFISWCVYVCVCVCVCAHTHTHTHIYIYICIYIYIYFKMNRSTNDLLLCHLFFFKMCFRCFKSSSGSKLYI